MSETHKDNIKAKRKADRSNKKRGVAKIVTIADEATTPPNNGPEYST